MNNTRALFHCIINILPAAAVACFLFTSTAPAADPPSDRKPNIIFINVDDMGWADLGVYGSEYYETPTVDKLAAEGMKFTDAYASAAICSPTRAAMMTGRYPARLGLTDWLRAEYQGGKVPPDRKPPTGYEPNPGRAVETPQNAMWLDLDEVTIAEVLRDHGYITAHIGKWHLGFDDWSPEKQGFDVNIGGGDMGEPPSFFDPYHRPENPDWKEPELLGIPKMPARKEGEYLTDREADEAVAFIRANRDRPFFLNLWHYAVHTPIQAKPKLVEKYKAKEPKGRQTKPNYAAMVESVDHALARVVEVLDELELASKTLIVFTSDNGGLLGPTNNAPLRGGKGMPYEGGIRVPLIMHWPGRIPAGAVEATPVSSVDFLPTFAEAAAVPLPEGREIDGESLLPLAQRRGKLKRTGIYWHFPHYRGKNVMPHSVIRDGGWKLIRRYDGPRYELFNLKEDIGESNDLSQKNQEKVAELEAQLDKWLETVGARMPRPKQDAE